MQVLIVARHNDGHVLSVVEHLTVPYLIINTKGIRDGDGLTYASHGASDSLIYKGQVVKDVSAVWCKQMSIDFDHPKFTIEKQYETYSRTVVRDFINVLSTKFENARWVSPYFAMQRASHKPLQLKVAKQLGFTVPDTIMTSDPQAAQRFVNAHDMTIVKPLIPKIATKPEGGGKFFFAAKVPKGAQLDYKLLPLAPLIFQTAIDPVADIRVFVVGSKAFAATITTPEKASDTLRDWRVAQFDGTMGIEAHQLPKNLAEQCIKLVKILGLRYGAIDLLLDKRNKYWFLEINTTGAWRFIEEETHQPISREMAGLLSRKR